MPYPKPKVEQYANLGGMDTKASEYITDQLEFLNLKNVDFRTLGSLSSFCGSTAYSIVNSTLPIMGVADYYGVTLSPSVAGQTNYLVSTSAMVIAVDQENVCSLAGKTFSPLIHSRVTGGVLNPTSFVLANKLYGCNGVDAWAYPVINQAVQFSLGKPCPTPSSSAVSSGSSGFFGYVTYFYSLVRQDGLYGPARAITYGPFNGATSISAGRPYMPNLNIGLTGNPGVGSYGNVGVSLGSFGLSGIQAWVRNDSGPYYAYQSLLGLTTGPATIPLPLNFGFTSSGFTLTTDIPNPYDYQGAFIYGLGSTQGGDNGIATGSNPYVQEYFYNQLFSANFASNPSRVIFSNAGTPEVADYQNFFDVAPNDPSGVTALKAYFTQLGIWKQSSTWALSGTGPDTFNLTQVSPIYGCISKLAVCVWRQNCWFLDKQGICEFNGANTQIVSTKVQPIFDRMNLSVAAQTATMIHVKTRNEVWCAIPIDGSSYNNIIVVYDYLAKAWYTTDCPRGNLTYASVLGLGSNRPVPFYGSQSGLVGNWSNDIVGDNGQGVTYSFQTRYFSDLGNTTTKMFRRLFLDATVPTGQTQTFYLNFYADHQSSPYYSTTMVISSNPVQQRIEFGVPAKAMSVEAFYLGDGGALKVAGFGIAYRYQRDV